jgi:hypothetical protein
VELQKWPKKGRRERLCGEEKLLREVWVGNMYTHLRMRTDVSVHCLGLDKLSCKPSPIRPSTDSFFLYQAKSIQKAISENASLCSSDDEVRFRGRKVPSMSK